MRQKVCGNARAGVFHAQHGVGSLRSQRDVDTPTFVRELHGVGEQVPHNLLQPIRIAGNRSDARVDIERNRETARFRCRFHRIHSSVNDGGQLHTPHIQAQVAGDDA